MYHYNMPNGCWLRLLFLGENKFYISVQDLNLRNILHPASRTIEYETFIIPGVEELNDDVPELNNIDCRSICEIHVTSKQAKSSKMVMSLSVLVLFIQLI